MLGMIIRKPTFEVSVLLIVFDTISINLPNMRFIIKHLFKS